PLYPFLPHYFSLWQLAPKHGKEVRIALIDTGIAAYGLDKKGYLKNDRLQPIIFPGQHNLNVVGTFGMDPLKQLNNCMDLYIDPDLFKNDELQRIVPAWVLNYLKNEKDDRFRNHLIAHANPEYSNTTSLTKLGNEALS